LEIKNKGMMAIKMMDAFPVKRDRDSSLERTSSFIVPPNNVFLVHGEENSKKAFAVTVKLALGYYCTIV